MADKTKIVLIDDDEAFCLMVKQKLKETGKYEVATSTDPKGAEGLIQQEKPKLILLDVVMPGRRGDDIVKSLKKEPGTKKIPIIIVSGKGEMIYNPKKDDYDWKPHTDLVKNRGEIPDCRRAEAFAEAYGVEDYVGKPLALELLINIIEDVLKRLKPETPQGEEDSLI